jgi:Peptidase family M28
MTYSLAMLTALRLAQAALALEAERELSEAIHVNELQAHVNRLASPEFLGRRGPGAARAARYIAEAFERTGLQPAFGDSYFQPIPSKLEDGRTPGGSFLGRNVVAVLPGSDPDLKGEWLLLSAHLDHIGVRDGRLFPGADDNATGVAMLIEVAEHFALRKARPRRTIVFAAFDLEETGLLGSTHFATHPPLPIRSLKAALTADMLGRSMANVMDEYVFVLGSEHSPQLSRLVQDVMPECGLKIGRLGADLIGTRSDYGPFRDRKVPFLFFSTGQHPDYHKSTDLPERIDYQKLRRASVWIASLLDRLANDAVAPVWDDRDAGTDLEEIRTVLVLVRRVLSRPDTFPLTDKKREMVDGVGDRLDRILQSGQVTADDRTWLLWSARLLLATVF